ncbi:MAG TPA: hypothetical protein VF557_16090 [Jatrophihabitans sp.]|jgi:stage V sporulation protein SpoVS|uniref:hypothetical protein n=1 Tax=Jatrophihabitans sp. TaxID=1932789 RepID=UPI002EE7A386
MAGRSLTLALLALAGAMAGCVSSTERSEVQSVAAEFVTAVQDRNGSAACALLTSEAEESASGATDVPCTTAVLNIEESGNQVHGTQIWGDAAQVKLGSDTVFLRRMPAGWQVQAAGCQSRPGAAYDCEIQG